MSKSKWLLVALLGVVWLRASASVGNDKAYRDAGNSFSPFYELGNRKQFLSVGYLKKGGSAVWIGGQWAVTNAHCVDSNVLVAELKQTMSHRTPQDRDNVLVITTQDETIEVPILEAYVPHNLLERDKFGPDIALLKLAYIPRARGLNPAILSGQEDLIGTEIVCSGYGALGLGSVGVDREQKMFKRPHRGLRFGFQNKLEHYTNGGFVVRFKFDEDGLPLEGCISSGDSGSGMFAMIGGQWQLVGVNCHSETGPNGKLYKKAPVYSSDD